MHFSQKVLFRGLVVCRDVPLGTYEVAAVIHELHMLPLPAGRFGMSLLCCGAIGKDNFNFKLTFALRLA